MFMAKGLGNKYPAFLIKFLNGNLLPYPVLTET